MTDDPELDGTDGAHPAWWRGHDDGALGMMGAVRAILDGKDSGAGVANEPWESLRRDLLRLCRNVRAAQAEAVREYAAKVQGLAAAVEELLVSVEGNQPERLAEIKARCAAATPGPWRGDRHAWKPEEGDIAFAVALEGPSARDQQSQRALTRKANALFIAHAREDVPALLAEVERLRAVEQAARDILPLLPPVEKHHIPSNNLRVALGELES